MTVISTCDATTDWTGTVLITDTTDKKEGTGSLVNTVASPTGDSYYYTIYNPTGTWDWSAKKHILFWFKCDRASTAFTTARFYIFDNSNNRWWTLTFATGVWTAFKFLLSTGDGESGTLPDLALMNRIMVRIHTTDTDAFYNKIDNVWVSTLPYDTGFTMTMDMKL